MLEFLVKNFFKMPKNAILACFSKSPRKKKFQICPWFWNLPLKLNQMSTSLFMFSLADSAIKKSFPWSNVNVYENVLLLTPSESLFFTWGGIFDQQTFFSSFLGCIFHPNSQKKLTLMHEKNLPFWNNASFLCFNLINNFLNVHCARIQV